jgi:NAD(P)-dependent dehydrogenase (short-subunit alcohol dehydrogenase family)
MDQATTDNDSVNLTKRLAGEVAIITGGAGGIGRAVATRLSQEGAEVAILDLNEAGAQATAAALLAKGLRAIGLPCNVTKRDEVHAAVEAVVAHFGRLTVLVNNAGIVRRAPFLELTDETWDEVLSVNLRGAFIVAQEAARVMAQHGSGRIVNMASVAAKIAHSNQTVYSVSKAGVAAMTRTMAFELAPLGITVNAIAPGTIATNFALGSLPEIGRISRLGRIPLGRFGSAAEVAAAVAFLASADAAYVTGAVLTVDGGLVPGGVRDTLVE